MTQKTYRITGMTCPQCEKAVTRAVRRLPGVRSARADYTRNTLSVTSQAPLEEAPLRRALEDAGYGLASPGARPAGTLWFALILLGLYVIARQLGLTQLVRAFPVVGGDRVGYLALFAIGLLTSAHCVAMCGGINLGQAVAGGASPVRGCLLYNLGRLTGYTLVGGLLGALGGVLSLSVTVRSALALLAGVFMVLMGINLAVGNAFLNRLTPRLPPAVARLLAKLGRHGPYAVGLLNALMPCGPLQSIQLYAMTSGGALQGALSMLFFCLGTIPLVFGFGVAAKLLQKRWKDRMLQASAALLVLFGVFMVQNNLALTGWGQPAGGTVEPAGDGMQYLTTPLRPNGYEDLVLQAGVPTQWTILAEAGSLNGCNQTLVLPAFDMRVTLHEGENVIDLPALEAGTYNYSCWMGMLRNVITVE